MININLFMSLFCLFSIFVIALVFFKPALMHDFDNPELNKAPALFIDTIWYRAEDLSSIQLKPINLIGTSILSVLLFVLIRVCNISYRQLLIDREENKKL